MGGGFWENHMQREIKFKRSGSNSVYGSFVAGDVMRCSAELAKHYVDEGVARYTDGPVGQPPVAEKEIAAKPRPKQPKKM